MPIDKATFGPVNIRPFPQRISSQLVNMIRNPLSKRKIDIHYMGKAGRTKLMRVSLSPKDMKFAFQEVSLS